VTILSEKKPSTIKLRKYCPYTQVNRYYREFIYTKNTTLKTSANQKNLHERRLPMVINILQHGKPGNQKNAISQLQSL